jgi:Transposase DDE domain
VRADLDALLTAIYVLVDDFLPARQGPGAPPQITDAELITLAIAQVFLGLPNDRQFLALARFRLAHLFPYLPNQPGYNKRLRRLGPEIARCINYLAFTSPSFCDAIWLLDFTPVPCGQSRETTRRSQFAGLAGYGYCRSHSRYFWGFRLYLVCARDGTPIGFELAPANAPEREVAKELLERIPLADRVVIADKGFAGQDFERFVADQGATLLRPDRRNEPRRNGSLGFIRQCIESVFWTCKGQLGLERHGARTVPGLCVRIAARLLALAAGLWHNWQIGNPGRHFTAYAH